jgi:hypothetical protein
VSGWRDASPRRADCPVARPVKGGMWGQVGDLAYTGEFDRWWRDASRAAMVNVAGAGTRPPTLGSLSGLRASPPWEGLARRHHCVVAHPVKGGTSARPERTTFRATENTRGRHRDHRAVARCVAAQRWWWGQVGDLAYTGEFDRSRWSGWRDASHAAMVNVAGAGTRPPTLGSLSGLRASPLWEVLARRHHCVVAHPVKGGTSARPERSTFQPTGTGRYPTEQRLTSRAPGHASRGVARANSSRSAARQKRRVRPRAGSDPTKC